jgi:hypothetical protein
MFVPVTTATSVKPTSLAVTVCDAEVPPPMATQFWPLESQRFHWYPNDGAGLPDHEPVDADRT